MNFSFLNIFALGALPPEHQITDNTNYAGQGIVAADVTGLLQLTGPSGIVYYSNIGYINDDFSAPDTIFPGFNKTVSLPLNGSGLVEPGTYLLDYKIKVAGQTLSSPIVAVNQGTNTIYLPGNVVANIMSAGAGTIVGSTGNDASYMVTSATYDAGTNRTAVILTAPALASSVANGIFNYKVDQYYQAQQVSLVYGIDKPCGKLEVTYECGCAKLSSRDVTNYGLWIVGMRTHRLIYPTGSNVADVVSTSALIQITDLYTNTYVSQLSVDISYSPSSGFTITDTITAQKDTKVICDAGMCCIFSCMKSVFSKYVEYKANGPQGEALRYQNIVTKIFGYWMLYSIANHCGDETEMSSNLAKIKELIDTECGDCCTDDCNNGDTTLVIPLCGPNGGGGSQWIYSVVPCGNNLLTVTTNIVADTVIYTVCVSEQELTAFITNILNNSSINDLGDVTVTGEQNGQTLVWNTINQAWENAFITLNTLNDVDVTTDPLQDGDILIWDQGTQTWINVRRDGIIYNNRTIVKTDASVGSWQVLHSFSIPAGSLNNAGSEARATTTLYVIPPESDYVAARVLINGVGLYPYMAGPVGANQEFIRGKGIDQATGKTSLVPTVLYIKFKIVRIDATTVKVSVETVRHYGFLLFSSNVLYNEFFVDITVADLDSNALDISIEAKNETLAVAEKIWATHLMVEKINKIA